MSRFEEFESPAAPVKQAAATAEEIRERFPKSSALVDELKASCPELFATAKTIYMAEDGKELKSHKYREIQKMQAMSITWWDSVAAACKRNKAAVEFANRRRR